MILTAPDIDKAFSEGRVHYQRFLKNAGQAGDSHWQDWSYASGQPAYDARIGTALEFTPLVAARNDAIYFPGIGAGQSRHLAQLQMYITAGGTGQTSVEFQMYDLLGVYPLIDGDSTDPQPMDNTQSLPRYSDGVGVRAILVNHVAPVITAAQPFVIDYTDSNDVARQVTVYSTIFGVGKASFSLDAAGASTGSLYLPTDGPGVKSIDSIVTAVAPGGLWAIYLVKPIASVEWRGGLTGVTQTVFTEKNFALQGGYDLPRIYDGAHLGFFYMPNGSARTVALFGSATFIWG